MAIRQDPRTPWTNRLRELARGVAVGQLGGLGDLAQLAARTSGIGYQGPNPVQFSQRVGNAYGNAFGQQPIDGQAWRTAGEWLPTPGDAGAAVKGLMGLKGLAAGASHAIISPGFVRGLGKEASLPNSPEFLAAVESTPGATIGPDGLTMRLQRNQHPDQAMEPSVRGGVFYLPEGSASAKHYSTGKNGYGGRERIAGETLIQKPLFVKGATGGKAPEVAFDTINGKGAYQAMRGDALRVRHPDLIKERGGSLPGAITPEQFLEKYAPDMAGSGDYIFRNSRQGNQLAYALQEAAVASAARAHGHDAILGYSKARTGAKQPFISEVFDVREKSYPSASGDFEAWPQTGGTK